MDMPSPKEALPGRDTAMSIANRHFVNGNPVQPPFPTGMKTALFGMGCFWGAEKGFWMLLGVFSTAVGYAAGFTPNPTYDEVCSGMTGHNEVVFVVYDPQKITYTALLKQFWENHDPTQIMRQGNDVGTQYRSGIYVSDIEQDTLAQATRSCYQQALKQQKMGLISTEILPAPPFYYAEAFHQQYLARNPQGYCGLGGCGVKLAM